MTNRLTGRYRSLDTILPRNSRSLVHAHFLQDGANILPFAMRHKVPLIVTAHGYDATVTAREHARRTEGLWYLALKPLLARYANGVVCVSNWIKQCLVDNGYPPDKLRVIRLGINVRALPRPAPAYQRRGTLFVGRLVEKKGVDYLLDAWSNLPAVSRRDPLTIIGDGPLMDNLVRKAERLAINVNFMGSQPRNIVFDAMARHRIFAMPSIRAANGDSEGLPIVLMEAQAMGMAVVVFDEGPMREAIKPCHSGLLAKTRDAGDFAEQLHHLISSPLLCEAMGQAGRTHVEEEFNIASSIATLEDYYDEVIARSGEKG